MSNFGRRGFWIFNKLFMVPMFRLGLGPWMGNRITGYIMVLKTIGRKSGKLRYAPVNYAIHAGNIYCMAGWGNKSDWYRNMIANKEIEVILPSGTILGAVKDIDDLNLRRIIFRRILKNAGFAGFFEGFNPHTIKDEELIQKTTGLPLIQIQPLGIGNGPFDPDGLAWIWTVVISLLIILAIFVNR
jgi:deazaflavin-dependent oxidoreductase (nitroreductase family)